MRVVLDSNVIISALIGSGIPAQACVLAIKECDLIGSDYIIEEVSRTLLRKFGWSRQNLSAALQTYLKAMRTVDIAESYEQLSHLRDPDDGPILICAIASDADYLITGDKDLLVLKRYQNTCIITPKMFIDSL